MSILSAQIASVLCGGTGPKLVFNFHGLTDDFGIEEQERTCFIDPSIGSGMGNIHCRWYDNKKNLVTPCQAYQELLEATEADVQVLVHDDVEVYDPNWLTRIMDVFENNPNCVAVGLGGATSLGRPNLYKQRYRIENMARGGYASNQRDAETHGERFTGDRQVAVLDAFFQAVRVDWLRGIGGWPVEHLSHHCGDLYLACMAARTEREIFMCGIDCLHSGGGTSVKPVYTEKATWLQGGTLASDHTLPHKFLFEEFRDCLPIQI